MKTAEQNGRKVQDAYKLLRTAGQGIRFAADTGYKTGYFMAKHPEVEDIRQGVQKNSRAIILTFVGVILGMIGVISIIPRRGQ